MAGRSTGQRTCVLKRDIWVVATLGVLFEAPVGQHLVFKGGTSLSKVWRAIRRFSEDFDITYDIRGFAPDLVGGAGEEALPPNRSQEKRWTKTIRRRLAGCVRDRAGPLVGGELACAGFEARVRPESECLNVRYDPLFEALGTMRPEVKVDFGARSTGEPHLPRSVVCDAAAHLPDLVFPEARPAVMLAERTFLEKATAIHVFCLQGYRAANWIHLGRTQGRGKPDTHYQYGLPVKSIFVRPLCPDWKAILNR